MLKNKRQVIQPTQFKVKEKIQQHIPNWKRTKISSNYFEQVKLLNPIDTSPFDIVS